MQPVFVKLLFHADACRLHPDTKCVVTMTALAGSLRGCGKLHRLAFRFL